MMGLFEHWPYVNFHDMNLDWVIKKIKNVETAEANSQASADASAESAAASQLSADASQLSADASQQSADASQLSADASQASAASISDKVAQIDLNTARINNIIFDGQQTEGNTELIDIRVGADGITYQTAGTSVRTQVTNINNDISHLSVDTSEIIFADGYVRNTGSISEGTSGGFKYNPVPFLLRKGWTVSFVGKGYSNSVSMIAKMNPMATTMIPIIVSEDGNLKRYIYTADSDMYIRISYQGDGSFTDFKILMNAESIEKGIDSYEVLGIQKEIYLFNDNKADGYFSNSGRLFPGTSGGALYTPTAISVNAGDVIVVDAVGWQNTMSMIVSGTSGNGVALAVSETDKTLYTYNVPADMNVRFCCLKTYEPVFKVTVYKVSALADIYPVIEENKNGLNIATFRKYGVCGDSLASGESAHNEGGSVQYVDLYDFSWLQFIARKTGNEALNFSQGGMTTRSWLTNSRGLPMLQNPDNKCDCYFIALGENDANSLGMNYLGTISDVDTSDPTQSADTYYGNYAKIIGYIKQVQPKAKIFCLTRPDYEDSETTRAFNTAVRDVSNLLGTYVIELTVDDYNKTYPNRRWGHYNGWGYNQWAEIIMQKVNTFMYLNANEFRQIEFIGTDYNWN